MKVYITGGTGLVGSNIIKIAKERYNADVIASQFGPSPEWQVDYELDPLDMSDPAAINASINKYKPDVVIHCAALLDQDFIHSQRAKAWKIMVEGTRAFAHASRDAGARFVFISSDWVFDGKEPLVDEDTPPFPVNFYGIMKMASERELSMMDGLNYVVARLAGVYGLNYAMPSMTRWTQGIGYGDLVNDYALNFTQGKKVEVWTGANINEQAHPTLASDVADMVLRLAQHTANGIFHPFGRESINRLDLAHRVAEVFNGDESLIQMVTALPAHIYTTLKTFGGGQPAFMPPIPAGSETMETTHTIRIPHRLNASTEKTAALVGRQALDVVEGLHAFKQEWEAFQN